MRIPFSNGWLGPVMGLILGVVLAGAEAPMMPSASYSPDKEGKWVERSEGREGYLHVMVKENRFRVYFYDGEKELIEELPYPFATIRYDGPSSDREFLRLEPAEDGPFYYSPIFVERPHRFKVWLMFFKELEGESEIIERYSFWYRG